MSDEYANFQRGNSDSETVVPTENVKMCEHCGAKIKENAQFCSKCGHTVVKVKSKLFCQSCGTELEEDEMFCSNCGATTSQGKDAEALNNIATYNEAIQNSEQSPKVKPKKKKHLKIVLIVLAILAVVTIVAIPEINYQLADMYQEQGNYYKAYNMFVELGDYRDSRKEVDATVLMWSVDALSGEWVDLFCDTVTLTSDQYISVYSATLVYIEGHPKAKYWYNYGATESTRNVYKMLKMLPAEYEETAVYRKLFKALIKSKNYKKLFEKHSDILSQCWSLDFVQNLAESEDGIEYFLRGHWTTYTGQYYIKFYEKGNDMTYSQYDLPRPNVPAGAKYYDIDKMIYYWDNADSKHLMKVWKFEFEDYDTMRVFCYSNNSTYLMYRR